MAAQQPEIQSNKHSLVPELCEIPLSLEQGDSEISAVQSHKAKSNSLKRLFRKSKSQVNEDTEASAKESVSLQMRFGTFHKENDGVKNTEIASGSSKSISSESKLNLPERLSTFWTNVFKRSPKKIPTAAVSDQGGDAPPAVVLPIEDNSPNMQ